MEIWVLLSVAFIGTILIGSIMGMTAHQRITKLEAAIRDLKRQLGQDIPPAQSGFQSREDILQKTQFDRAEQILKPQNKEAAKPAPVPLAAKDRMMPAGKAIDHSGEDSPEKADPIITKAQESQSSEPSSWEPPSWEPQSREEKPWKTQAEKIQSRVTSPKSWSFEEELGARWAVWVGGIALLFGAVFLLRYSIEAGVFTPAMRVAMATVLGGLMLSVGEALRRGDIKIPGQADLAASITQNAYIPGVLTAVGIFTLLGTTYAAYALYEFISPEFAFALLGALSLGGLFLGLLHGPKLSALGLVAAFATPLLVQTDVPNAYGLFGYLTIISLTALALARLRQWGWLNLATLFGALGWLFIALEASRGGSSLIIWLGFMALGYAASTYIANQASTETDKTSPKSLTHNPESAMLWAAGAGLALYLANVMAEFKPPHLWIGLGGAAILLGTAWLLPRQKGHALSAAALGWALLAGICALKEPFGFTLAVAIGLSAAVAVIAFRSVPIQSESDHKPPIEIINWAALGAAYPVVTGLTISAFYQPEQNSAMAWVFLVIALANAGQAYWRWQRAKGEATASTTYMIGAAAAYLCTVMIGLSGIGETLGLIAGTGLFALAAWKMRLPANRWIALFFAGATALHVLFLRLPEPDAIGQTFIANELWIYFALPALICWGSAKMLERVEREVLSESLKAFALSFAALFVVFQIRHAMNDGQVLAGKLSFDELSLQILTGLCFTLGGSWLGHKTAKVGSGKQHENLIPLLSICVSALTLFAFLYGLCLYQAPLFNYKSVINGGVVFNSLILAYLLPAVLLGAIAWMSRGKRPKAYIRGVAGLSFTGLMFYITTEIRRIFSGDNLSIFRNFPDGLELYAISAAWLLLGIALLTIGIKTKRRDIRLLSAFVITLTVIKAFLVDMAGLEGVLRALSFVVLGLVLIVIGRVYQRLLFSGQSGKPDAETLS